jgi:hypothetical protein
MTRDPPSLETRAALWRALSDMRIEEPGRDKTFIQALCEETGWTAPYAARAVNEYRRFLYLAATTHGELTPSQTVDRVWHLHLEHEHHYWHVLCGVILDAHSSTVPAQETRLTRSAFGPSTGPPWTPTSAASGHRRASSGRGPELPIGPRRHSKPTGRAGGRAATSRRPRSWQRSDSPAPPLQARAR